MNDMSTGKVLRIVVSRSPKSDGDRELVFRILVPHFDSNQR